MFVKPQSAKAKGRNLQKFVVERILSSFPQLLPDDVRSTSMGCFGEDVKLSPAARRLLPISIECKNKAKFAVYKDYEQATANCGRHEPVLIIKQNRSDPLAVISLDYFLGLLYEKTKSNSQEPVA